MIKHVRLGFVRLCGSNAWLAEEFSQKQGNLELLQNRNQPITISEIQAQDSKKKSHTIPLHPTMK